MLRIAINRIDIQFDEEILMNIMKKDRQFINKIRFNKQKSIKKDMIKQNDEEDDDDDEEHYLVDMVAMGYSQVVKVMLFVHANAEVVSKKIIQLNQTKTLEPGTSLFDIAYYQGKTDILFLLLSSKPWNEDN